MKTYRAVKTLVVFLTVMSGAVNIGTITTTLPDMEKWTSSTTAEMSTIFVWMGVTRIVGALAVGPLFDRVNGMLMLSICLLLQGISVALAPIWPIRPVYQALAALTVAFQASLLSGSLSINRKSWKASVAWQRPVIYMTTLMVILGNAIGPQIARPFIDHNVDGISSNVTVNFTESSLPDDDRVNPVQVAYLINGALDFGMAIICLLACIWSSIRQGQCCKGMGACFKSVDEEEDEIQILPDSNSSGEASDWKLESCSRLGCTLIVLMFLYAVLNTGRTGVLFTGLLFTYLYEYVGWSADDGARLVSVYQIVRFVSGIVAVPVSRWVSPAWMNGFQLLTSLISAVLMSLALFGGDVLTIVGVIVAAFGLSIVHSTTITLVDETIDVSAPVMALFVSSSGIGSVVVGPIAGALLSSVGMESYPLGMLVLTLIAVGLFVIYMILIRTLVVRARRTTIVVSSDADDGVYMTK